MAYVVCSRWTAKPGEEDAVAAALRKLAPETREEPGNVLFTLHHDPSNPRVFAAYEQWRDEAAYRAHLTSPHFMRYGRDDALPRLESRERWFYETWDV